MNTTKSVALTLAVLSLSVLLTACGAGAPPDACAGVTRKKKSDLDWALPLRGQDSPPLLLNASASTLVYENTVDPSSEVANVFRLSTSGGAPTAVSPAPALVLARQTDTVVGTLEDDTDGNPDTSDVLIKRIPSSDGPVTTFATYTFNNPTEISPAAVLPDGDQLLIATQNQLKSPTSMLLTRVSEGGARSALASVPLKGEPLVLNDSSFRLRRLGDTFFAEASPPTPTQSQAFQDSYDEVQLMAFPAAGGSSNVVGVDAPLVRLVGSTDTELLVATLKPVDAALKNVDVRFWRLPGGVGPGVEFKLEGGRRAEQLDPVWAQAWAGAPGNAFSPDRRALYFLPTGATEARVVACFEEGLGVRSLVGAGSTLFAAIQGELESGIARFSLP